MSLVEITIGKSKYKIPCKTGEEEVLIELSKKVNNRINEISQSLDDGDEKNMLVIAALMIEEELNDAKKKRNINKTFEDDIRDGISENMDNVSDYIEKLANKIKNY